MLTVEKLFEEMDKMSPMELARSITNASSHQSQFLVLAYLNKYPAKREEVQTILDKDSELMGAYLDGSLD